MAKELTSRAESYAQWYNDLVLKADLAENSAVRDVWLLNPMVMPYGKKCNGF
jgi:prolyl-tRNA synthetase